MKLFNILEVLLIHEVKIFFIEFVLDLVLVDI